jgi:hypothetical protein
MSRDNSIFLNRNKPCGWQWCISISVGVCHNAILMAKHSEWNEYQLCSTGLADRDLLPSCGTISALCGFKLKQYLDTGGQSAWEQCDTDVSNDLFGSTAIGLVG